MKTKHLFSAIALSAMGLLVASCDEKPQDRPDPAPIDKTIGAHIKTAGSYENKDGLDFFIGYTVGYKGSKSNYYLHEAVKLDDPNVTITGGMDAFPLLANERAPHAYRSHDGKLYSLTYRVGDIVNVAYNKSAKKFEKGTLVQSQTVIGNNNMRFTLLSGTDFSSVHEISMVRIDKNGKAIAKDDKTSEPVALGSVYNIVILDNKGMKLSKNHTGLIEFTEIDGKPVFISRIHSPVITGGKIYYGAQIDQYPDAKFVATKKDKVSTAKTATLIFDYPSFENPQVIYHKQDLGSTTGYRSRNMFLAEDGKTIYQLTGWTGGKVHMLKIVDGKYQDWSLDIAGKCGHSKSQSFGWFYAGNGIAFVPYQKGDASGITFSKNPQGDDTVEKPWGIARVDLNTGNILDLEVPSHTLLTQYQEAAIRNGKIYFAITPVGENLDSFDGHVHIWDVKNTVAKPKLGAKLVSGSGNIFNAIF